MRKLLNFIDEWWPLAAAVTAIAVVIYLCEKL
jgi:hypothetical protein